MEGFRDLGELIEFLISYILKKVILHNYLSFILVMQLLHFTGDQVVLGRNNWNRKKGDYPTN